MQKGLTEAEMSAWIARALMGWVIHDRDTIFYVLPDDRHRHSYKVQAPHDWSCLTPDAMVKILEKLDEKGYGHTIRKYPGGKHECCINKGLFTFQPKAGVTLPLAVAKAVCEMLETKP